MANSFEEDLILRDPQKAAEIVAAMKKPRDKTIKPSEPPPLPKNANEIWFGRDGYVEEFRREIDETKEKIESGEKPVYDSISSLIDGLEGKS